MKEDMTTPFMIIAIVFDYYGIPFENRCQECRKRELVEARQVSMYYLKKYTKLSLAGIGSMFKKDHATALHSIRTINNYCDVDKKYRQEIERINNRIFGVISIDDFKYAQYDTDNC